MTDAHHDVAGLVARLRQAHENSQQRIVGSDIFQCAADRLEFLSQALREAETERDSYLAMDKSHIRACENAMMRENDRAIAAESRLAEAMKIIQPFAALCEMHIQDVMEDSTGIIFPNSPCVVQVGHLRAARAFIAGNGGEDE